MLWIDLLDLASNALGESIPDNSTTFFQSDGTKLYAAGIQNKASIDTFCIQKTADIATVAGTEAYTLPVDFRELYAVYDDDQSRFLTEMTKRPQYAGTASGTPLNWFVEGNTIAFYPVPAAVETMTLYYYAKAPIYALRLKDGEPASRTAVTVEVKADDLEIVTSGDAEAGTYNFNFSTYVTVASMATAIGGQASAAVAVAVGDGCVGTAVVTNLEVIEASTMYAGSGSQPNRTRLFFNPVIPEEMQMQILLPAMQFNLKASDREGNSARMYYEIYRDALEEWTWKWRDRNHSTRNLTLGDNEPMVINPSSIVNWATPSTP